MPDLNRLKKDLGQLHSIISSGSKDLLDSSERTLRELVIVMESIDDHEALLKKRGHDKLEAISAIVNFIRKSGYSVAGGDYSTLIKTKGFVCDLVNDLNKQGFTIVRKEE